MITQKLVHYGFIASLILNAFLILFFFLTPLVHAGVQTVGWRYNDVTGVEYPYPSVTNQIGIGLNNPSRSQLEIQATTTTSGSHAVSVWDSASTNLFEILGSGNIGMGTSTPTDGVLTIVDSATASRSDAAVFNVHARSSTPYTFAIFDDAHSKLVPEFQGLGWNSTGTGTNLGLITGDFEMGNANAAKLAFYTNGYQNPRLTITGTGLVGIGTTSPTQSLLTIATPIGSIGALQSLFRIASSTTSATSTLFDVNTQGDVTITDTNGAGSAASSPLAGLIVSVSSTIFNVSASGGSIHRAGTSNPSQFLIQGTANALSAGSYSGLLITTGVSSTAGAGSFSALKINPTLTVANASGTGLNYLISSFDGVSASTTRGFYQMAGVGAFANNIGMGSTSPFAKLSVHAQNGDLNTTLFAIGSSTATATTTLFAVNNVGQQLNSDGTALLPSIAFGSDTSLGIYKSAVNTLTFSSVGTARFQVAGGVFSGTNAGTSGFVNVGASVTAPDIVPNRADSTTGFNSGTQGNINTIVAGLETSRWTGTGYSIGSSTPFAKLSVHANPTDQVLSTTLFAIASSTASATTTLVVVDNMGEVGIGTSTPATLLDIFSSTATSTLRIDRSGTGVGGQIIIKDASGSGYTCIYTNTGTVFSKVASSPTTCNP